MAELNREDGAKLLATVEGLVPKGLSPDVRDDVVQNVVLSLLEQPHEAISLRLIKKAIRDAYHFRDNHHALSLDEPINKDDGGTRVMTWADRVTEGNILIPVDKAPISSDLPTMAVRPSPVGHPRRATYVKELSIFLSHHSKEKCGKPYTKFQHKQGSYHATCPQCGGLMHPKGCAGSRYRTAWRWYCSLCFTSTILCEQEGLRRFTAKEKHDLRVRYERERHKYELRRIKAEYWIDMIKERDIVTS